MKRKPAAVGIVPVSKKYPLSRVISMREIVSADYVQGMRQRSFPHSHQDAWELCFCQEGDVVYIQEGREQPLRPGQVIFTSPGVGHDLRIEYPETVVFVIAFTCSDSYIQILRQRVVRLTRSQEQLLERIVEELRSAFELKKNRLRIHDFVPNQNCPLGAEQLICCYLELLIIGILRAITVQNGCVVSSEDFAEAAENDLVNRINYYIDRHYHEQITVESLCQYFHYGRTTISTVYKKVMGIGINAYLTRLRLEKARELLKRGECTVTRVSEQVGFSTPQYFTRKFSAAYGCTPTQYAERFHEEE